MDIYVYVYTLQIHANSNELDIELEKKVYHMICKCVYISNVCTFYQFHPSIREDWKKVIIYNPDFSKMDWRYPAFYPNQ